MMPLQPSLIDIDPEILHKIDDRNRSIYRLIVFDKNHHNSDLLERYLEAMEHLKDVLSIKNAQQEAQTNEEAVIYLEHLKEGLSLIVSEIAAQRSLRRPADLFMLLRAIAPDAMIRTPNHYRQTDIHFGNCMGADPKEISPLVDQLFLAMEEIQHPILKAIYLHHELIRIHPFVDGNGRLARLGKNWMLMYNLYPPMFINNYSDKKNYVEKLEASFNAIERDPTMFHDATRDFFADELIRLRASAGFVLDRMLKDPDVTFDSLHPETEE